MAEEKSTTTRGTRGTRGSVDTRTDPPTAVELARELYDRLTRDLRDVPETDRTLWCLPDLSCQARIAELEVARNANRDICAGVIVNQAGRS
jgi:hypothetical protein